MESSLAQKSIYLSVIEFYALVQRWEIENLVIFEEVFKTPPDERAIIRAVSGLINKGWLKNSGDALIMNDELRQLTQTLKTAPYSFSLRFYRDLSPMKCVYVSGGDAVSLEMDGSRKGYLKVNLMAYKAFLDELAEYDFIPKGSCIGREADTDKLLKIIESYEKSEGNGYGSVLLSAKRYCGGSADIGVFLVRDTLSDVFIIETPDVKKTVMYSKERLHDIFTLLGEKTKEEIEGYDFG